MNTVESDASLEADARASITIGKPADELRDLWQKPDTQSLVWAHFATLTPRDDRRIDWMAHGPRGGVYQWQTHPVEGAENELRWASLDGADVPNVGSATFRPAPGDRGTELSLDIRFDPPGGSIGVAVSKLFHIVPREIVSKALYRFRALALTGEVPRTDPQPAARNGGIDR
ncbi:hypothetical protein ACLE20_02860 [Rhizobium sp. YIM 134829]|uniref:SRPBCC family protein n=1 Tax=Rhizobium sp. YIM 134829 TaxID=3390453 RepID=UPI00397C84F6